jgi:hypothetical protein
MTRTRRTKDEHGISRGRSDVSILSDFFSLPVECWQRFFESFKEGLLCINFLKLVLYAYLKF